MEKIKKVKALSKTEKSRLESLESTIQQHFASFIEVGKALITIREERLYRAEFKTFELYCHHRWELARSTAYQLIDATKVVENVRKCGQIPANEAQVRPLTKLAPEQQRKAWDEAVLTAPHGKVTAKHVENTVRALVREKSLKKPERDEQLFDRLERTMKQARSLLSAIRALCRDLKNLPDAKVEGLDAFAGIQDLVFLSSAVRELLGFFPVPDPDPVEQREEKPRSVAGISIIDQHGAETTH